MSIGLNFLGLLSIGMLTGLRTIMPIAVLCWMARLGRLSLAGSSMGYGWADDALEFVGSRVAVGVFSLGAVGELVGDKLPMTPDREKAVGLVARIVFGALCATILAAYSGYAVVAGASIGAGGAVLGTFAGWFVRTRAVAVLRCPDLPVALLEDAIAVAGSILVCSLFTR